MTNQVLRSMEIGQSIVVEGREYIKTKQGFKNTNGFKFKQSELVEKYSDSNFEIY